jgi:hypothetical protein
MGTAFWTNALLGLVDLQAPTEVVKQIVINIESGVEVEVTIAG